LVAGYSETGMVTKPKLMVPFQSALIKSFNISPQRDLTGLKKALTIDAGSSRR
jgi:hypothetical protein